MTIDKRPTQCGYLSPSLAIKRYFTFVLSSHSNQVVTNRFRLFGHSRKSYLPRTTTNKKGFTIAYTVYMPVAHRSSYGSSARNSAAPGGLGEVGGSNNHLVLRTPCLYLPKHSQPINPPPSHHTDPTVRCTRTGDVARLAALLSTRATP